MDVVKEWKFSQCFGEKGAVDDLTDADILSTVEFNHNGKFLATGDKGGRIVIFQRSEASKSSKSSGLAEYRFYTEFQSHEPEFDYLKSLEIEEKINSIRWCKGSQNSLFLISTNDKTIKLWKLHDRALNNYTDCNFEHTPTEDDMDVDDETSLATSQRRRPQRPEKPITKLKVPKPQSTGEVVIMASPRRVFSNAHAYHINSISINSDGETYLSADDLRINLWNIDVTGQCFNVVDIKPANMEELTEVITAAEFHPSSCNMFMYSSSRGSIKLGDLRDSALCQKHSKIFESKEEEDDKSFFSEIIASISDVKFAKNGRYIISRDYLTMKVWDINMESQPVQTIQMHDQLRPKLCDLYENDCIFDKFECAVSSDGEHIATGSYNNIFHVFDKGGKKDVSIECTKGRNKRTKPTIDPGNLPVEQLDFGKKALHLSWHPTESTIAVAGLNNLYIYSA